MNPRSAMIARWAGVFADGWTPADIQRTSTALDALDDGWLICRWSATDEQGPTGHSELLVVRKRGAAGQLRVHPLARWAWHWLVEGAHPNRLPATLAHATSRPLPVASDWFDDCNVVFGP